MACAVGGAAGVITGEHLMCVGCEFGAAVVIASGSGRGRPESALAADGLAVVTEACR